MFCIKIADVVIGIRHRFPYVKRLCRDYIVKNERPAFCVKATFSEIREESGGRWMAFGNAEGLCIYRRICRELLQYDAFLMHSAVVAVDGEAFVFAAKSGVGKSTHLRRWVKYFGDRAVVVNGDKPVFRFVGDQLYACGTPWRGKENYGTNIMVPVKAIYFLERSETNSVQPMPMAQAMRLVFHQLLMPKEEGEMEKFLSLVERMLSSVELWQLKCNKELESAQVAYARGKTGEI